MKILHSTVTKKNCTKKMSNVHGKSNLQLCKEVVDLSYMKQFKWCICHKDHCHVLKHIPSL